MLRKPFVVTSLVTICLVVFHICITTGNYRNLAALIFLLSPFLIAWLAYTIMKYGKYSGPELRDDEEWGYQDKDKSSLGTF
jgi:hypothetical protein